MNGSTVSTVDIVPYTASRGGISGNIPSEECGYEHREEVSTEKRYGGAVRIL